MVQPTDRWVDPNGILRTNPNVKNNWVNSEVKKPEKTVTLPNPRYLKELPKELVVFKKKFKRSFFEEFKEVQKQKTKKEE